MTADQQRVVIDFVLKRASKQAVNAALGFDIDAAPSAMFELLQRAAQSGDASSVDCALLIAHGRTAHRDLVPLLAELLRAPWHYKHEDLARWLQDLRDARAIDALYETALTKHAYLAYDDGHALARKCTWALADIGTPEAEEKLRGLAACGDPVISEYAQKRLDRWQLELPRKASRLPRL